MPSGVLYIIPSPLDPALSADEIPKVTADVIKSLKTFVCENGKTSRKVFKNLDEKIDQSELEVFQINKHDPEEGIEEYISRLRSGEHIGFMSEAGLPGVADPGSLIVRKAHENEITVKCMPGSSSLVMALSGSGLNGQKFCFHGYLPRERKDRADEIRKIEKESAFNHCSQILIETPYRNEQLMDDLLKTLNGGTLLAVASGLNSEAEAINTKKVSQWKEKQRVIGKTPTVFIIYAGDKRYLT
jgi:16S rRNA (cytidine1402-2'-O)-methyltransferase